MVIFHSYVSLPEGNPATILFMDDCSWDNRMKNIRDMAMKFIAVWPWDIVWGYSGEDLVGGFARILIPLW